MKDKWELKVGKGEGIKCEDEMWVERYIMKRVYEEYGVIVKFEKKKMNGKWNG
jgi:glutamine synthetase